MSGRSTGWQRRACLGRTITHSKRSISCSHFHCFQQTGESASRSEPIAEASTSSINARFVHGIAHLLFSLLCIRELAVAARYSKLPVSTFNRGLKVWFCVKSP